MSDWVGGCVASLRLRFPRVPFSVLASLFGLVLFVGALVLLDNELRHYHYRDIVAAIHQIPAGRVGLALLLTVCSYLVVTGFDYFGFRQIRRPQPYRRVGPASFTAYAFSHNVGMSVLSGGAVRFRLYSSWGVSAGDIARIVLFCVVTFLVGVLLVGGFSFLFLLPPLPGRFPLPSWSIRVVGGVFLGGVAGYLVLATLWRKPLRIWGWDYSFPRPWLVAVQVVLGVLDWMISSLALYCLLPPLQALGYPQFLSLYMLSLLTGMLSNVPGALGVFESMLLLLLSGEASASALLGSLIAFRAIYYLTPLVLASVLLGGNEALQRREAIGSAARRMGTIVPHIAPYLLAATTFLGGAILLVSGVAPAQHGRLQFLNDLFPLGVMELSHFAASLIGAALLVLARGLVRRLDAAYLLSLILLALGIVAALLRGLDYEEATALTLFFLILVPSRPFFYRRASLFSERFTSAWVALVVLILLCAAWLGYFAYKHVEYADSLWWQFALQGDAPRFLRAGVGTVAFLFLIALARILRAAPTSGVAPSPRDLDDAFDVIQSNAHTYGHLALVGDKSFLFSPNRRALIMYAVERRSWVAMGDPIGPSEEVAELAWQFHSLSNRHGGTTAFYLVRPEHLPLYLDLGLTLVKLGEEARVPLRDFALDGADRRGFRRALHSMDRQGGVFEIIPPEALPPLLPELRTVSDQWLARKHTREKGFSLGVFNEAYLARQAIAVVRLGGHVVAFANLWQTRLREEVSVDLMRSTADAPEGTMDYLFVQLMRWAKQEGYEWFNLGMAPLSGLQDRALGPLWNRLGALVFRHGEHFYNFQGLRRFKAKFDPAWEPRYLAVSGGFALPRVLADLVSLIGGGLIGAVRK